MNEAKDTENQVVEENIDSEEKEQTVASGNEVHDEETVDNKDAETTSSGKTEKSAGKEEDETDAEDQAADQSTDEKAPEEQAQTVSEEKPAKETAAAENETKEEAQSEEAEDNTTEAASAKEQVSTEEDKKDTEAADQSTDEKASEEKAQTVSEEKPVKETASAENETKEEAQSEEAEDNATEAAPAKEQVSTGEDKKEDEASDQGSVDETDAKDIETAAEEEEEDLDVPEELTYYQEIVQKGLDITESSEWQYASLEFDNLRHKWGEGPDASEEHTEIYNKLNDRFQKSLEIFNERKSKHYDEVNRQKLKNLERKKNLLERLEKIIEDKKWHAYNEVKGIQKRWDNIKMLPSGESQQLVSRYKQLLDIFEENRVEYLVKRKQKEEDNLQVKLLILDKMELILKEIDENVNDWKAIDKEYQELLREWKKVGRVPREKSGELWQRYKAVRSNYIDKKLEFNDDYRNQVEGNIDKKIALCKQAEALLEKEDLASSARTINKLHKRWKETGPVPREKAEELWDRFKTASDTFNKKKSENIELLRDQEKENYEEKLELCAKAEAIQDTDDWKGGTKAMQDLMETWKEIGPVPRRKTRKIWKRFKKAMDVFYQRKRDHFKDIRAEQKENLKKKRALIDEIKALGDLEDAQEAVNKAKPLQAEFAKIGFVPLKHKNKIYKHYREACDVVYQRARAERSQGKKYIGPNSNLDAEERKAIKKKGGELSKLKKECNNLKDMILKYQDSKTFIKPNKKGMKLREEIQSKIDEAEKQLDKKLDKIDDIQQQIEDIKNGDEE